MTLGNHQSPVWLEGRWEGQKHLTAIRIGGAVASLRQAGTKITYASILPLCAIALRCFHVAQHDQT
jgi:hypothetical protein